MGRSVALLSFGIWNICGFFSRYLSADWLHGSRAREGLLDRATEAAAQIAAEKCSLTLEDICCADSDREERSKRKSSRKAASSSGLNIWLVSLLVTVINWGIGFLCWVLNCCRRHRRLQIGEEDGEEAIVPFSPPANRALAQKQLAELRKRRHGSSQ